MTVREDGNDAREAWLLLQLEDKVALALGRQLGAGSLAALKQGFPEATIRTFIPPENVADDTTSKAVEADGCGTSKTADGRFSPP